MTTASGPTGAPVADQTTLTLVNTFVAQTVDMLNRLNAACERKLADAQRCARTSWSRPRKRPSPRAPPPTTVRAHRVPPTAPRSRRRIHSVDITLKILEAKINRRARTTPRAYPARPRGARFPIRRTRLVSQSSSASAAVSSLRRSTRTETDRPSLLTQRGRVRRRAVDARDGDESAAADGGA